ncbi:MAG: hypothetical protein IKZ58_01535 [Selenomonadaceae bacterium]|nr:hypothetical protein [Selenomonadaceae bacterium]
MRFFLTTILIFMTAFLTSCGISDSPEDALQEIQESLNKRDFEKFSARVDTEKLFAQIYEDATIELAKKCDEFGKKYPKDPYFQHDGEFIKNYNAEHRELHLDFARKSMVAYFENLPAPDKPQDNPYAYVAHEFTKIYFVSTAEVEDVKINGNSATVTVNINGDRSLLGIFVGFLNFELGFEKIDGKWILTKIENIEELTPTIVDKAELIWINL